MCLGRTAKLTPVARDQYKRLIAHVRCETNDAARAQLASGLAWVYTRHKADRRALQALEESARNRHLGLWSAPFPEAPWTYRQSHRSPR
ncbi:thermonuclease family protein [Diaphorobacter aerolatus]|uniref:thermonuclease family protein n=1 Tax=Diaphorobacter aerolatus TaxID=1288495 RepID=UPI0021F7C5D3|nr:thermonuclease family protein [Diaphorobacter aerolatus]